MAKNKRVVLGEGYPSECVCCCGAIKVNEQIASRDEFPAQSKLNPYKKYRLIAQILED